MSAEIKEMKCPYCGDVDNQVRGELVDSYEDNFIPTVHWKMYDNTCLWCKKHYFYGERYSLMWNTIIEL